MLFRNFDGTLQWSVVSQLTIGRVLGESEEEMWIKMFCHLQV